MSRVPVVLLSVKCHQVHPIDYLKSNFVGSHHCSFPPLIVDQNRSMFNMGIQSKIIMYTLSTELLDVAMHSNHFWRMINQEVHVGINAFLLVATVLFCIQFYA